MNSPLFNSTKSIFEILGASGADEESRPDVRDGQEVADDRELEESSNELEDDVDSSIIERTLVGHKEGVHSVIISKKHDLIFTCSEFGLKTSLLFPSDQKKRSGKSKKKKKDDESEKEEDEEESEEESEEDEEEEDEEDEESDKSKERMFDLGVDYGCCNHMILWDEDTAFIATEEGEIHKFSLESLEFDKQMIFFNEWTHEITKMMKISDDLLCCITPQTSDEGLVIISVSSNQIVGVSRQFIDYTSKTKMSNKYTNTFYLKTSEKEGYRIKSIRFYRNNSNEEIEFKNNHQRIFDEHTEDIFDFQLYFTQNSDNEILVCGGKANRFYFYDTRTSECVRKVDFETIQRSIFSIHVHSDRFLFFGDGYFLSLYDLEEEEQQLIFQKRVNSGKVRRYKDKRKHLYGSREGVLRIEEESDNKNNENFVRLVVCCDDKVVKIVRVGLEKEEEGEGED